MNAILSVNSNGYMGDNNNLIYRIPEDLKRFKAITTRGDINVIIMGRFTHESIGKALPGRCNIVLSQTMQIDTPGVVVVRSPEDAVEISRHSDNVFVIGGPVTLRSFSPYIKKYYITSISDCNTHGDAFFDMPDLCFKQYTGAVFDYENIQYSYETWISPHKDVTL